MKRNLFIGVLAIAVMLVTLAPANLLRIAVTQIAGVDLVKPQGTVWHGNGVLIVNPGLSANLSWQVAWQISESLTPTVRWQLSNDELSLRGSVALGLNAQKVAIEGNFSGLSLEPALARYDISIPGTFQVTPTLVLISESDAATEFELVTDSKLFWSGGTIRYVQSNGLEQAYVPALTATIKSAQGSLPTVFIGLTENSTGPLLTLTPELNGYVNIVVTRGFIELVGRTWTGSAKYNDVVLEVKRKVF